MLFDDAVRPSVKRVIRHALTYPCYEIYGSTQTAASGPTTLGRLRAQAGRFPPGIRTIVRPNVITRDWDLGALGAVCRAPEDRRGSTCASLGC